MGSEGEDVVARWRSVATLGGDLRVDAADALADFLRDPHPFVRWHASKALAETASALQQRGSVGRSNGVLTFAAFWSMLEEGIRDGHAGRRTAIADGLGLWSHPRSIDLLTSVMEEDDGPSVRASAARALGRIGDRQAVQPLCGALGDECLWVQRAAARALGQIGAPESVDALREALVYEEPLMRGSVVVALGHIRTKEARRALVDCLQDEDPAVRWYAARGLAEIGEVENVVPLQALLEDDVVLFDRAVGEVAQSAIVAIERRSGSPWHWLRKQIHVVKQMVLESAEG